MKDIHKKVSFIAIGLFANTTVNFIFDYILYPTALVWLGTLVGGIVMTVLSVLINFSMIIIYSIHDIDWFGFEEIRLRKDKEEGSKILKFIFGLGHWPAFIALSFYDPFLAFVYARGKRKSHKHFSLYDWVIFIVVHIIGNGGWIIVLAGAIGLIKLFLGYNN